MNYPKQTDQVARIGGTKSDKIRELAALGLSRSDIARQIGVRYQFVRNVLVEDERRQTAATSNRHGKSLKSDAGDPQATLPAATSVNKLHVRADGSVLLPASLRQHLGVEEGGVLFAAQEGEDIHLLSRAAAVRRAQAIVRQFVPDGISLVDELLEDRRREAEEDGSDD